MTLKNRTLKKKKKILNIYNDAHVGDALFVMIYFYNCKDYIIKHNIHINYYIRKKYISQIEEFKCCASIHIYDIDLITPFPILSEVEMLMRNDGFINSFHYFDFFLNYVLLELNLLKKDVDKTPYNKYLANFYSNHLSVQTGLPKMKEFSYTDPDLLHRYKKFTGVYKNNEILIINSKPRSFQYDLDSNLKEFNGMIRKLSKNYKLITTAKVKDIPCTLDGNLTLKDIGAISTHVKYIIAINTGPLIPCLNTYALKNVKKWYIFDIRTPFNYTNFELNKSFKEILDALEK